MRGYNIYQWIFFYVPSLTIVFMLFASVWKGQARTRQIEKIKNTLNGYGGGNLRYAFSLSL